MHEDLETAKELTKKPLANINQSWADFIRERWKQKYIDKMTIKCFNLCENAEDRKTLASILPEIQQNYGDIFEEALEKGTAHDLLEEALDDND